ncbi:Maf family protein [Mycolicibacterium bacteremicum]|uniref:Nucleoside triphosphate pyrophosphatase n=1 Tax=Mycolicibacterium bacteremicum TaxID=564198 RepID=A0A1W9Z0C9_MYCBA|nr:Maf family nucleotide pyrophosphatase [Mycolicibacterium bacteremicum]MCV7435259.1 septum formation inhibitor Maf [Mycolicibacterium bacteremicum]ORA05470.1 septum formation inhibitor Maf [Mycolicibacterium bacteremicum]
MTTRLVLGSASSGRLGVLRSAGVDPLVVVSDVDEDAIIAQLAGSGPAEVVAALAAAKADRVVELIDADAAADCVVVGCDSMLEVDGRLSGKPGTVDRARQQWQACAGRTGVLHTGHTALRVADGRVIDRAQRTGSTTLHFGSPTDAELQAYLASGEPLFVAGAFTLDGLGGWFIERIEGDPSNVIGISLPLLRNLLAGLGISVAALWQANGLTDDA